jgi:hypothetical protein
MVLYLPLQIPARSLTEVNAPLRDQILSINSDGMAAQFTSIKGN